MTNWLPDISNTNAPLYIAIADAIEADISNGKLPVGTKLPPQRNVAFDIGVTIGTISRGYALACERGLVSGEVGRGTYVLDKTEFAQKAIYTFPEDAMPPRTVDSDEKTYHLGFASCADIGQSEIIAETAGNIASGHPTKIMDYIREIPSSWREAGAEWLSVGKWRPLVENIAPSNGALAGGLAAIATISTAGDKIVMEDLSYPSIARSASLLGRRIITTELDEHGIVPESFEKVCAQQHPKILYLMTSVHNPTLAHLPQERRIAIAEIAHRYNVWIIEDAIYAPLVDDQTPPIAKFAPERTFHVGGLSKSVSAGIRSGWVACPDRYVDRVANAHKMLTGGAPYWLAELASTLVLRGEADNILSRVKEENIKRHSQIKEIFDGFEYASNPSCPYVWVKLPEPWHSGTFKSAMLEKNISISTEEDFKPARTNSMFHGVRIGLTSVDSAQAMQAPLKTIRDVLNSGITGLDLSE